MPNTFESAHKVIVTPSCSIGVSVRTSGDYFHVKQLEASHGY